VTSATRTLRVGIAAFAQLHVNNVAAFHARRPQGEMLSGALPQVLVR